jgi:hypothetical protein
MTFQEALAYQLPVVLGHHLDRGRIAVDKRDMEHDLNVLLFQYSPRNASQLPSHLFWIGYKHPGPRCSASSCSGDPEHLSISNYRGRRF